MKYLNFDIHGRDHVIARSATLRGLFNYQGSRKHSGMITTGGGGHSFARSPAEDRNLRERYNSVFGKRSGQDHCHISLQ
jgi:hypothetical protein